MVVVIVGVVVGVSTVARGGGEKADLTAVAAAVAAVAGVAAGAVLVLRVVRMSAHTAASPPS